MNWRRWLGFDPAGKIGGVEDLLRVFDPDGIERFQLRGSGLIQIQPDRIRQLVNSPELPLPYLRLLHARGGSTIERQLTEYSPPDPGGKTLADKEKKALHLDDYQPRDTEHAAYRMFWERSFPEPPKMPVEEAEHRRNASFVLSGNPRDWVHYRNRHPGVRDVALGTFPPMRGAMADLLGFLTEISQSLKQQQLVAVEVAVQHEPAEQVSGERQGWHYRVEVLAVPMTVLLIEEHRFEEMRAKLAESERKPG